MSEYSNYVESRLNAAPLTGAELIALSQGGNARKTTTQAIADLVVVPPSSGNRISVIVTTTGSTITLNSGGAEEADFAGSAPYGSNKTIAYVFDSNLKEWNYIFEITVAGTTTNFGANTRSPHPKLVGGVFTVDDVGLWKVKATRYGPGGTLWLLDFNGVYSVGDAPPEPPTGEYLEYDDGSDVEYDDGSKVEYA